MKNRIVAGLLALVVVFNVFNVKARAEPVTATAIVSIGILAFQILGVLTGQYDDAAEAIGCFIEGGVEGWQKAFIGDEDTPAWWSTGFDQISSTVTGWFESGDITIGEDGTIKLTQAQYQELCAQMGSYVAPSIDFGYDGDYSVFTLNGGTFNVPLPLAGLASYDSTTFGVDASTLLGQSYVPIMYSDTDLYIFSNYLWACGTYVDFAFSEKGGRPMFNFSSSLTGKTNMTSSGDNYISPSDAYPGSEMFSDYVLKIDYPQFFIKDGFTSSNWTFGQLLHFNGTTGGYTQVAYDSVDVDSLYKAYVITRGDGVDFVAAVSECTTIPGDSLEDLTDVIPPDASLIFDTSLAQDPDVPITDTVIVSDVPAVPDATLTEYLNDNIRTDIDIPSVIIEKFPFCIPFDFIRILGVFAAEPKAPVFRIPISTNPDSLKDFEGNQTIGELPEDFTPMFEIDEEIVIDLSVIPFVQPICYTAFIVGFVMLLIHITPKMIHH